MITDLQLHLVLLTLTGLGSLGVAIWCGRLTPERLPRAQALARARLLGAVLALFDLLCCVPHARPISFDWLVPLLYPLAVAGAVLGYFFLDYLFSRAFGGLLILTAYAVVHGVFEFHTPGAPALTVLAWLFGGLGIAFSGRPCWFRDLARKMAGSRSWRWSGTGFFLLNGLLLLLAAGMSLHG